MIKRLLLVLASASMLLINTARAENSPDTDLVLLTENFPPYNMAKDGKNFAKGENINGIAADIVREMFKRAGVTYSLTLRFPWERVYKLALENPGYGAFVMARLPDREKLFKWVGPIGPDDWIMLAKADSKISLESLEQARKYNEKKGLPTTPIINDPAFASSILKENRHQGTEALTKNKPSSQGPMDIDAASNVKSSYHHQSDSTIMLESVDAAGNCLILDAD